MKWAFLSRTILVNSATTALSVLALIQGQNWIVDYPRVVAGIGVAIGALNVYLRFVTTVPVTVKRSEV